TTSHTEVIRRCGNRDQDSHPQAALPSVKRPGQERREIGHEKSGGYCHRAHPCEQKEPAKLHPHKKPERGKGVKGNSHGFRELRRNLDVTRHDDGHGEGGEDHRKRAGSPEETIEFTRQGKYATTDRAIDDQGGHRPAPDRPNESHRSPHIVRQSLSSNQPFGCSLKRQPRRWRNIATSLIVPGRSLTSRCRAHLSSA